MGVCASMVSPESPVWDVSFSLHELHRYREDTVDAFVQYLTKKGVPLGAVRQG